MQLAVGRRSLVIEDWRRALALEGAGFSILRLTNPSLLMADDSGGDEPYPLRRVVDADRVACSFMVGCNCLAARVADSHQV